ncbi:DUF3141 domain-containing protein [Brevundimonas sp. Root1279]|uniref:DUF3141 domain-containing protein n=1 Tax=Brevundimonas sp. Root1279 TaxID=1736443 RepID=UPI0006FC3BA8|nr:DUF3141 domain-containing protein [Brevundimonas sp. Root1279]KQW83694.1 hypothetical protein ASC65_03295 [Brevundimonas sp. Root1279]
MASPTDLGPAHVYWVDAVQRSLLFLDVLRRRGNDYYEHRDALAPHVLDFDTTLIRDGRTLPRPVNYVLVRIEPAAGTEIDRAKPPVVVIDPRAGHGPGIGGMKQDSEIGVALAAGHPAYFIGFLPDPHPGQTIEDVWNAEAAMIQDVIDLHPEADGKPIVIANCQAGWQTMIMAATRPELCGPIVLAGSPLSYWAGARGLAPMRYLGGMLGGVWTTALAGDLGAGTFDGANLVRNFEAMNPANTLFDKPYNVYSKVDTEADRFLEFETWWGSPVLLNAEEMVWIAENLFVGNRLTSGQIRTRDGLAVDLRAIQSPIIVFCSWGDDITPPQQALGWITDLYADDEALVANGQTLVYCLHQTIGHLGIFVSGKVAAREHSEFVSCMGMIELMPPGLYEAVITEAPEDSSNPELIDGRYLFRLEPRTLEDLRALGCGERSDEPRFEAVAKASDINLGLYRTALQPAVRTMASPVAAEAMRELHPNRLRFSIFSDRNPFMPSLGRLAEQARNDRRPVAADNPFMAWERAMAHWTSANLQAWGKARDAATEAAFLAVYGSPAVQATVGAGVQPPPAAARMPRDVAQERRQAQERATLETRFENGGPAEAAVRALLYVGDANGAADERAFTLLRTLPAARSRKRTRAELRSLVAEQHRLLDLEEERAILAIPGLLPPTPEERRQILEALHEVIEAPGEPSPEVAERLDRIDALFETRERSLGDYHA